MFLEVWSFTFVAPYRIGRALNLIPEIHTEPYRPIELSLTEPNDASIVYKHWTNNAKLVTKLALQQPILCLLVFGFTDLKNIYVDPLINSVANTKEQQLSDEDIQMSLKAIDQVLFIFKVHLLINLILIHLLLIIEGFMSLSVCENDKRKSVNRYILENNADKDHIEKALAKFIYRYLSELLEDPILYEKLDFRQGFFMSLSQIVRENDITSYSMFAYNLQSMGFSGARIHIGSANHARMLVVAIDNSKDKTSVVLQNIAQYAKHLSTTEVAQLQKIFSIVEIKNRLNINESEVRAESLKLTRLLEELKFILSRTDDLLPISLNKLFPEQEKINAARVLSDLAAAPGIATHFGLNQQEFNYAVNLTQKLYGSDVAIQYDAKALNPTTIYKIASAAAKQFIDKLAQIRKHIPTFSSANVENNMSRVNNSAGLIFSSRSIPQVDLATEAAVATTRLRSPSF